MNIESKISSDNSTLTIIIKGNLDINLYKNFNDSYHDLLKPGMSVIIDMAETKYMDSSALGMFLMLREQGGGDTAKISIINCSPGLQKILKVANFQKLFTIKLSEE
ncbi:STAS-domain containing protein PA14_20770 [Candidatus Magnetomoraceae bacterium gMMP-15]